YVIVAAFVCQTNNPSTDKTLFTSTSAGRRKKRRKGAKPLDNESPAYAAGRAAAGSFPLERLLSVLASLCPPELRIAGVVYGVVDSLVSLGLLWKDTGEGVDMPVRLKCLMEKDRVRGIAEEIDITLDEYLLGG
ncbi:hypothetical protein TeGR_g10562, partial [Tetraparma gracilis]